MGDGEKRVEDEVGGEALNRMGKMELTGSAITVSETVALGLGARRARLTYTVARSLWCLLWGDYQGRGLGEAQ